MFQMTQEEKKLLLAALNHYKIELYKYMDFDNYTDDNKYARIVADTKAVIAKVDSLEKRLSRPIKQSSERGI